jgi:[acyl-carrier-protein] S-malonyltransferase
MTKQAIIFPGQGSQSTGMGRDVAEASAAARDVFKRADDTLGFDVSTICFKGPDERLECTDIQQPAIFVTSVAVWEALRERGATPDWFGAAAGLSLGEYSALHVAGALSFEDAVRLVHRRGQLMQEASDANPSGMVSLIGADEAMANKLCDAAAQGQVLSPANFNCPGQIVISGAKEACGRALEMAADVGCRAMALKVAGAFHTDLMASASEGLSDALAAATIQRPRIPVLANVSGEPHGDPDAIRTALVEQLRRPVLWQRSMERLIEEGYERFVEVGAGRVLKGLMRKIDRRREVVNVGTAADLETEIAPAA